MKSQPDEREIRRLVIAEVRNACDNQDLVVFAKTPLGECWATVVFNVTVALSSHNLESLPVQSFGATTGVQELVNTVMECLRGNPADNSVSHAALLN
ncbi:MAG: hypothetical protein HUU49_04715 [Candidatus Buchananbacteria bacterium]|nr:hypothetical protein [Candidatus Buchananbacteria bacterium]